MYSFVCSTTVNTKHKKAWNIKVFQLIMVLWTDNLQTPHHKPFSQQMLFSWSRTSLYQTWDFRSGDKLYCDVFYVTPQQSREIAPIILNHGITRGRVVSSRLSCLTLSSYWQEAGWAPGQVWMPWRRKHLLPLSKIKPWSVSCLSHATVQIRITTASWQPVLFWGEGQPSWKAQEIFPSIKILKQWTCPWEGGGHFDHLLQ